MFLLELLTGVPQRRSNSDSGAAAPLPELAPRVRQTLGRLLQGDSEKQIASRLGISPHTIHVYIKTLYRTFNVNSRGELLARFVAGSSEAIRNG
jgi:DNA-binding CsgD family transcriptional regulator